MAATLVISVRFTVKELRCELSSSFNVISNSEEGVILFLHMTVMFEMKNENGSKRKHRVPEFFHKQEEKAPFNNLTTKLANRESFLVEVSSSDQCLLKFHHFGYSSG